MIPDEELRAACDSLVERWQEEILPMLEESSAQFDKILAPTKTTRARAVILKHQLPELKFGQAWGVDEVWKWTQDLSIPDSVISFFGYSPDAWKVSGCSEEDALWVIATSRLNATAQQTIMDWGKTLNGIRSECQHLFKDAAKFVNYALEYMANVDRIDASDDEEFRKVFCKDAKTISYKVDLKITEEVR